MKGLNSLASLGFNGSFLGEFRPPNFATAVQWLGNAYKNATSDLWFQKDKLSTRTDAPLSGSYLDLNGTDNTADYGFKPITGTTYAEFEMEILRTDTNVQSILNGEDSGTNVFGLIMTTDNKIYFLFGGASNYKATAAITGYTGELITVKAIYDGGQALEADRVKIYLNGVEQAITSTVGVIGTSYVGSPTYNYASGYYSATFRAGKYLKSSIKIGAGTTSEWYFDEKDGATIFDTSGNENHGTLTGTLTNIRKEDATMYSYNNEFGKNDGGIVDTEIVTNGGFDTDSDWVLGAGFTISGGTLNLDVTGSVLSRQSGILTNGKTYEVTFSIVDYTSGIVRVICGDASVGLPRSSAGTFTETITAAGGTGTTFYIQTTATSVMKIDNVSIKESYPSTVKIPADQSSLTLDVIGNALLNSGKVGYDAQLVGSNCVNLNGTDNYIPLEDIRSQTSNEISFVVKGILKATPSLGLLIQEGASIPTTGGAYLRIDSLTASLFAVGDGITRDLQGFTIPAGKLVVGELYEIVATASLTEKKLYINGELIDTKTYTLTGSFSAGTETGANVGSFARASQFLNSDILDVRVLKCVLTPEEVTAGNYPTVDTLIHLPLSEGAGNHYNVISSVASTPAGTLTSYYTTSDYQRPNNMLDGFDTYLIFE